MEKTAVISDAGPLISIACTGGLTWLHALLPTIAITPTVKRELLVEGKPGVAQIESAIATGWLVVLPTEAPHLHALDKYNLDDGERSAISAAYHAQCLVILDELKARRAVMELKIPFIGTAGLLIQAKENKLIETCAGELEKLVGNGFYISNRLVEAILRRAGESIESHPKLQKIFIP